MESRVVDRDAFTVMGLLERFTDENEDVGGLWGRFESHRERIMPFATDGTYCGVACRTDQEGTWDYLAGMVVADVPPDSIPDGVVVHQVPAACYVVAECTLETMDETFKSIYEDWLPHSPYERDASGAVLDCYLPNTESGDVSVVLYVPIVRIAGEKDE